MNRDKLIGLSVGIFMGVLVGAGMGLPLPPGKTTWHSPR